MSGLDKQRGFSGRAWVMRGRKTPSWRVACLLRNERVDSRPKKSNGKLWPDNLTPAARSHEFTNLRYNQLKGGKVILGLASVFPAKRPASHESPNSNPSHDSRGLYRLAFVRHLCG